ncbi:NUDIX domain-containing protein [Deinococcus cellulosilyticus]|uniref:DNA mismatch repair protein MutT n=1 Tax=Deinococcus cellulosilyticus (strain DSM 18568 / NBRC 106333 / KACC 11606 / 5516J-15) TaxID=1223518 RepID=A0A511N0S6_DEIC1|nr:NUDIX hydrolase [Deinococcus cellulosilyticus]GEM46444.1 DNA mismatch repair protein MutT [Deinococcus cellulosilyticus NBRC 106333 = KACC 11606]
MRHRNWDLFHETPIEQYRVISTREIHPKPRRILVDHVETPTGMQFEYVYRPLGAAAVFILPITESGEVALIDQYRHPLRRVITEVPAGSVEPGEDVFECAKRELLEEVGGEAKEWHALPAFFPQPAFTGAVFYPFVALGVTLGEPQLEESELLTLNLTPVQEVYRMLDAGEILDGNTVIALFQARPLLQEKGLL